VILHFSECATPLVLETGLWELPQCVLPVILNGCFKDGTELQVFVAEVKKQIVGVAVIRHEEVSFCSFCVSDICFVLCPANGVFADACWLNFQHC